MLMKYIGLLYLFISKVSSRIGTSLKGGKGISLSLLPPHFLPLLSPFILSPFSIPFCSSSLIPPFQFFPLSHPYFLLIFSSPSPFSLLRVPFPSLSSQFYFYLSVTHDTMFYYCFKLFAESTVMTSQKAILRIHL